MLKENPQQKQSTEWEQIFGNDISDNGLMSKIYKELIELNTHTHTHTHTHNPVKNEHRT